MWRWYQLGRQLRRGIVGADGGFVPDGIAPVGNRLAVTIFAVVWQSGSFSASSNLKDAF